MVEKTRDKTNLNRPYWDDVLRGKIVEVGNEGEFSVIEEAATASSLGRVVYADKTFVDKAVVDSGQAFQGDWSQRFPNEHTRLLYKVMTAIRKHADELTELEAREVGKGR